MGRVDSGFFESDFGFFGFGRDFYIPKHKAVIMKEKNNLYLEGIMVNQAIFYLVPWGRRRQVCPTLVLFSYSLFQISACQTWNTPVLFCPV